MKFYISPNYCHEKIENPQFDDLVDVFQDRIENWVLRPSEVLLREPPSQVAAIGILISYFEGIQIYLTGRDSRRKSKSYFINGFCQVFSSDYARMEKVAATLYELVRCGFSHDGLFKYGVFFSTTKNEPILITYARNPDGSPNLDAPAQSIIINPHLFYESIKLHFKKYLSELKEPANVSLREAFMQAVQLKWGLDKETPVLGMSEQEFLGGT